MDNLQKAIENITYYDKKFPEEEFQCIRDHAEEAKPYLRAAVDRVITETENLEEEYELHLYALFFLGEFQDKESFERIMSLASLPPETLDELIGDVITEGLGDILYHTYNGNLKLLEDSVRNPNMDEFARTAMLHVMGQLYVDGVLGREEWQNYLKDLIWSEGDIGVTVYTCVAGVICECHLIEMLPDVRHLFEEGLIDEWVYGKYDSCVDIMFEYRKGDRDFCKASISTDQLRNWAMFEQEEKETGGESLDDWKKFDKAMKKKYQPEPVRKHKVGRNDPCPCGSGRKYKHCCLNKPQKEKSLIESEQEQKKWLKNYPDTGMDREEGRIYLEDYFDSDSIEIDKLLYLGLKNRNIPIWERQDSAEDRKKAYLWEAFLKYTEKLQKENIAANKEYDEKYSIHYPCREWQRELLMLLKESGEEEGYHQVLEYYEK